MLKEIRDQLIADIKSALSITHTDKYRGELEEGSEWNPSSESIFVQVVSYRPKVKANDNRVLKSSAVIKIYAGANTKHDKDALDLIESLINLLAGSTLTVGGNDYKISITDEGMDLILYEKGFEGYAFMILVQ